MTPSAAGNDIPALGAPVLLLDASPDAALMVGRVLERHGCRVQARVDCPSAIDSANLLAIFVDIHLARAESFAVIAKLQAIAADVPIIFITHDQSVATANDAVAHGALDFIARPVSEARLIAVLHSARVHRQLTSQLHARTSAPLAVGSNGHVSAGSGSLSSQPQVEVKKMDDLERDAIQVALGRTGGSAAQAAKLLGISTATIYRKIKQYCLA